MHGRLPTAILLSLGLLSADATAADEPVRPPVASVSLSGGFSYRDTSYGVGGSQAQLTRIQGVSPWLFRLRADWFWVRFLGIEGEASGDFFRALKDDVRLPTPSQRGGGRLGVTLRLVTEGGFVLSGALGYGISSSPVVRVSRAGGPPFADGLLSHGPTGRAGLGYFGARFEALAGATALFGVGMNPINAYEPQLWLAGRVADGGPTALWVGLDVGMLLEASAERVHYEGATLRFALGLKLQLLSPASPKPALLTEPKAATTVLVQVLLPDGAPAAGALVSLDGGPPEAVDAQGKLISKTTPGAHSATAKLAGHRVATASVEALEGRQTSLLLRLEALTGPGQLFGAVKATATGKPVAGATVTAGEAAPVQTGVDGTYRFASVGPGPVQVKVEAQGYATVDELAQVPPESAATLDLQLDALGKGSPATVRGLVRSRSGEALKVSVRIKGLAKRVQVSPEGRFFVTVPGGTYLFIISAPGYVTQTKKVVLSDGDQAIVHTELQKVSR